MLRAPRRFVGMLLVVLALCAVARADEIGVSSADEIAKVAKTAKPGDVLVMKDGEWKDQAIKFAANGTADEPIEMRAQTAGGVKLLGNSSITFQGDHLVASGLYFGESDSTESAVAFEGSDCRFTDSAIVALNRGGKWIHFRKGQRNRMDHCYLEGHAPQDVTVQVEIDEKIPNEARIDHNHFGPRPPLGKNGGETMRIGYSGQQNRVSKTLVEHNLFDRCDGEVEIISSKCTGSTYRYNTFRNCEGTITLRHGGHCTVEGNFFFGRPDGKSGGIRVIGAGHTIINNYFENVGPTAGGVIALTAAMREPKPTEYQHVNGALIAFNTIVNCGLPYVRLDSGFAPDKMRDVLPKDVIVANNLFVAGKSEARGSAPTLVAGQEGTGFQWTGNIGSGAEVGDAGTAAKGIKIMDPKLAAGEDHVMRPAPDSPVRGAAEGDQKIENDIDGQPRGAKKDVGADQLSDAKATNKPLEPKEVGPSWMKDPRGKTAVSSAQSIRRLSFALDNEAPVLKNDHLRARVEKGQLVITPATGAGKVTAMLCDEVSKGGEPKIGTTNIDGVDAIEVRGKGAVQQIWLPKDQPFVLTRVQLQNTGSEPLKLKTLSALKLNLEPPTSGELKLFGSDGPAPAAEGKTSYVFLVLADAKTHGGVVTGWLTHEKGSGIVDAAKAGAAWDARSEFGTLTIAPGKTENSETFAVGFFNDIRDGLEAFADETAKLNHITLKTPYNGYSTWYHAKALDQSRMAELAKFAKEQHLTDYGLNFLQIDDQWQIHRRDFVTHKTGEKAPYPDGMKKTADTIKANGLFAGLWLTPFGWQGQDVQDGKNVPNETSLKDKPDYFVKRAGDGGIYQVKWAGDCLDMSNPQARQFLKGVIHRMTDEWGYKLLKIDGLWAGMAVKILYPSPKYRDDGIGDAVFFDKSKTNVEVYRDGLKLVREAAGPDTFLLGCNIAQNMRTMGGSIGLVDAMRIGPDIKADWSAVVRCATPATYLYFWNGRVWWNDPDCLMLREPLTVENGRAWGSWIAMSGQMNLVSEWLPGLPPERLDIYKRTIPNHHLLSARPVDLLEGRLPRIWHLHYGQGDDRRDVVALFNWNGPEKAEKKSGGTGQEEPTASEVMKLEKGLVQVTLDVSQLGLPADGKYVAFDFWDNKFVEGFTGKSEFELPPGSCKVIALTRQLDRPQVVSTSRHVSQGAVDLSDVKWDAPAQTLSGKSKVITGDDYELRLDTGSNGLTTSAVTTTGNGASAVSQQDGRHVRVTIKSPTTGDVAWSIRFRPQSASAK